MSFHARLAEDSDLESLNSFNRRPTSSQSAFARLTWTLNLEKKQFGVNHLAEFQTSNLRLDEIERLEVKDDHVNPECSAFKHLDYNLRYFCELCNKQLTFTGVLTHVSQNEHLFRFTQFRFPIEYNRIDTLDTFEDQLAAIKSLLERITEKTNENFNREPNIIKVRNRDDDIKRHITRYQRRLYQFRPEIRAKLVEDGEKPPTIVKKQIDVDEELENDEFVSVQSNKTGKARLASNTSMEDLTQANKRLRSTESEMQDIKQGVSLMEIVPENEAEIPLSQASEFDILFDEENDDYGKYIERLNRKLVDAAENSGEMGEGYLVALNEFFYNLELCNDVDTLLKLQERLEKNDYTNNNLD